MDNSRTSSFQNLIETLAGRLNPVLRAPIKDLLFRDEVFGAREPDADSNQKPFLPIEYFRWPQMAAKIYREGFVAKKTFISSGTTQHYLRSQSAFSSDGLLAYQLASLWTFSAIQKKVWQSTDWKKQRGICLIPKVEHSTESSLAQMLSWISDFADMSYIRAEDLGSFYAKNQLCNSENPVWIFGTSLQFAQILEKDLSIQLRLPRGSIVYETGGPKGLQGQIDLCALRKAICGLFDIPEPSLLSEYGMCELASQAYYWKWGSGSDQSRFRFPRWVGAAVVDESNIPSSHGSGCLLINDRMRIDVVAAIRTQDLAHLASSANFDLNGRLIGAPLKGCSLSFDTSSFRLSDAYQSRVTMRKALANEKFKNQDWNTRIEKLSEALSKILCDRKNQNLLAQESGSINDAQLLLEDLQFGVPKNAEEWKKACTNALAGRTEIFESEKWLFLPPKSHSLAMLYPVSIAIACGFDVTLRITKSHERLEFLNKWAQVLREYLPQNFQIDRDVHLFRTGHLEISPEFTHIFCFGTNESIATLKRASRHAEILGFDESLAVSCCSLNSLERSALGIIRDAFSMGQQGCMSSRILFLYGENPKEFFDKERLVRIFSKTFENFWKQTFTKETSISLRHEALRIEHLFGADTFISDQNSPLFALMSFNHSEKFLEWLGASPFVLYIDHSNMGAGQIQMQERLKKFRTICPHLKYVYNDFDSASCSSGLKNLGIIFKNHGDAHRYLWDGFHEGKALFGSEKNPDIF